MDKFYNEATKFSDELEDCQSPEGLGETENSFDLTALIYEDAFPNGDESQQHQFSMLSTIHQNNEFSLIEDGNNVVPSNNLGIIYSPQEQSQQLTQTSIHLDPTSSSTPKLGETVKNLSSITQTSLNGAENPLDLDLNEYKPNTKANSRRRKMDEANEFDTPDYRNKRDRNNIAVRKSREKARIQQKIAKDRVESLRQENKMLENKVIELESELKLCRSMFINTGTPVPQVLEDVLKGT